MIETIQFNVCKQEITTCREKLVSDTLGSYRCKFNFDANWDGLNKVAVFVKGKTVIETILDENNECAFADELLENTGTICVGVYGTKDGVRYPTIKSKMLIIREGVVDGVEPTPPSQEIWEQLLDMLVAESNRAKDKENTLEIGLNAEIERAKARENEIEAKIPSHDNFATKEELQAEALTRLQTDEELSNDIDELATIVDTKADKADTYTKAEVDEKISQATPQDYEQVKQQVETNKNDIASLQSSKQDNINDLEQIRQGASKGATAVQDTDYVHTDNNFTAEEKNKLQGLENYDDTEIKGAIQDVASSVEELQTEVDVLINDDEVALNKTWSSQKIADRLNDIELAKFPNVTIIGQPTIQQGQISNFSRENYCRFPFVVDFQNQAFELDFEITTGNDVTQQHNVFDSVFGLAFAVRQSKFVLAVSTNGTSWNIGEVLGSHIVLPNTTYRIKLVWDKVNLTLEYSTDGGSSYVLDSTRALTEQPYPKQILIGVTSDKSTVFNGIINLNYATLSIANKVVWQGMDDVGLATRLAVDMSNIDEAGINKVKEIILNIKYKLVKEGLVGNDIVLTDEEKLAIETWLGLSENYLTYYNEIPYQVNGDYNPTHKKYVNEKLGNYYTKQETYSKEEVDNLIQPSIYGVSRALNTSSSGWSRTGASIGKVANATKDGSLVANDFDVIYPWSKIKSCNMTADGVVTAWYGDVNFKFDGSNGDVMTYIPPYYYRRWQDGTNEHIQISKFSFDGASYSEGFYIGRYNTDNDYKSRNNQFGRVNTNIGTFRTNSKAKGAKWQQLDWHYFLLEMLYLVEYADYNSQVKLGRGYADCSVNWTSPGDTITEVISSTQFVCSSNRYKVDQYITIGASYTGMQISDGVKVIAKNGSTYTIEKPLNLAVGQNINSSRVLNGQCDGLGMRSGCYRNDGIGSVIYRGVENIFGNIFQFVDGLNIKDYIAYINYNPTTYASDVFTGDYAQLGYTNASGSNAYIKKLGYDSNHPMVGLPIEIGGAESTYITDYYYQNSGNRIALVGGSFSDGGGGGLFYWYFNNASSSLNWISGARLLRTI